MEGIAIFLFLVAVFLIIAFFTGYRSYASDERKKEASWPSLASKHDLTYTPGVFLGPKGRISGFYRDCYLTLETFHKSDGESREIYTALVLRRGHNTPLAERLPPHEALSWFVSLSPMVNKAALTIDPDGRQLTYQINGLETNATHLERFFDLMSKLLHNYEAIITLESEAAASLETVATGKSLFRDVAVALIGQISQETTRQFGRQPEQHLCKDCLVFYEAHTVRLGWWRSLTYYGCRQCRQSRDFLNGRALAVLDNQMTEAWTAGQDGVVRLNWLARREPMDFDEVHIVRASDEDVERFAVQAGNDTDPKRRDRYPHIPCTIAAECRLSTNTLRILERTFGDVAVLETVE